MKSDIWNLINDSKTILIMTHENPDGDAIGSSMAIYHLLINLKKDVDIIIPEYPKTYEYLTDIDHIKTSSNRKYDLAIVVDTANEERVGQINSELSRCNKKIVIDHHISNKHFGDINYVEEDTISCCQVLYYLFKEWNVNITKTMAEDLLTGCLTDSNGFRNKGVDANTFLMAADIVNMGIDIYHLYYLTLSKKTMAQYKLIKMALDRIELFEEGKIAFSYISQEDMANVGALKGDHEGLVDLGRSIEGVEVSIFMREDDGYRISFRSNGLVDVNKLAKKFGGGGHLMAAGSYVNSSFKETKENVINETIKELSS